jgi:hypothetical protein
MKQELNSHLPVKPRIELDATASKDPAANALHWCKKRKRFEKVLKAAAESALTESALAGSPLEQRAFEENALKESALEQSPLQKSIFLGGVQ